MNNEVLFLGHAGPLEGARLEPVRSIKRWEKSTQPVEFEATSGMSGVT